jgi:hypothetical protein
MERVMEFFEAPAFIRYLPRYLDDEQYRTLQDAPAAAPELGDLMPGTGGFRKLRWADSRRGGLRVIYYWFDVLLVRRPRSDLADDDL